MARSEDVWGALTDIEFLTFFLMLVPYYLLRTVEQGGLKPGPGLRVLMR
jgi:hypothetical protein